MTIQRRFAPISGRFEPERVAGFAGISTCAEWEAKLRFPVRRIDKKSKRSRVFAFKSEIDEWFKGR